MKNDHWLDIDTIDTIFVIIEKYYEVINCIFLLNNE